LNNRVNRSSDKRLYDELIDTSTNARSRSTSINGIAYTVYDIPTSGTNWDGDGASHFSPRECGSYKSYNSTNKATQTTPVLLRMRFLRRYKKGSGRDNRDDEQYRERA
jgi:hypothetical protein